MNAQQSASSLEIRIHGGTDLPTLVYLPGIHGDWTLVGAFRSALEGKVRFVEFAYPVPTTWSLREYASAVALALRNNGITRGWLIGESFGSQVVWPFLQQQRAETDPAKRFQIEGIILAGGFGQYPIKAWARLGLALIKSKVLVNVLFWVYPKFALLRHRHAPAVKTDIPQFLARRARLGDLEAIRHRLQLVIENSPCEAAIAAIPPVYCLTGLIDLVVPWPLVNRWFRQNCASFHEAKVILKADHIVLGTAPEASALQVLKWMRIDPTEFKGVRTIKPTP